MPELAYDGHAVQVNPEGFLLDKQQWTPELANVLAGKAGIGPLTAPSPEPAACKISSRLSAIAIAWRTLRFFSGSLR